MRTVNALPHEYATGRYLGCKLEITNPYVNVYSPTGRWIGRAYSMSGARRLVRGYRGAKR